jgi:hypothetical protein
VALGAVAPARTGPVDGALVSFAVTNQGMNVRSVPTAYVAGSTTFYTIAVNGAWVACPGGTKNARPVTGDLGTQHASLDRD